jgi:ABC-type amino acid transport substrate-binding protein
MGHLLIVSTFETRRKIMKQHSSIAVLLLVVTLTFPDANLFAEGTLDKIARTGEFVIGYRTDSLPLSYDNADGQPSGYSVDLCRRIAAGIKAHLGNDELKTKFVRISADERISAVVDGKVDIECGSTTITLSRQELVDFSLPTFATGATVISRASSGIQTMSDLSGKKVGVAKDTTTIAQLESHLEESLIDAEIVIVPDRTEGMTLLNMGRIDALASDQIVLIGMIMNSVNPRQYSLMNSIISYEPYGFAVRRNDADFRLVVNRAIAQLYRSGQQADMFYKWIGRAGVTVPPILAAMYQLNTIPE